MTGHVLFAGNQGILVPESSPIVSMTKCILIWFDCCLKIMFDLITYDFIFRFIVNVNWLLFCFIRIRGTQVDIYQVRVWCILCVFAINLVREAVCCSCRFCKLNMANDIIMLVDKLGVLEEKMEKLERKTVWLQEKVARGNERNHRLRQEVEHLRLDASCIYGFTRGCMCRFCRDWGRFHHN
jgi:hypothetical protein